MTRRLVPTALLALALSVALPRAQPTAPPGPSAARSASILSTLRGAHPRLVVLDEDLSRLRAITAADPRVRRWRDDLQRQAGRMLEEPVVERVLRGPRLLAQSRAALQRITTLAGLYRLDRDPRKLARAKAEMLAAASWPDWNPTHFVDVAEMTAALAIGYDWLHADLTAQDRAQIGRAILAKGLEPGLDAIDRRVWWAAEGRNYWTQVCLGGLALGALAMADEAPAQASRVLHALQGDGLARRLRVYAPDGGDEEGPGHWDDATTYTTLSLAALETALGTDLGLGATPGLADTGRFRMQAIGPAGAQFNYAEAEEAPGGAPQMFWLAGRFDRPEYAAHERAWLEHWGRRPGIFHLLWAPRIPARPASLPPASARFAGIDVAFLRGDWRDSQTTWVGVKGGRNTASHGHLDLGSFVFDAIGERWAVDLGPDDYDLPEYFGRLRWSYYRLRTESHNTLIVNGGAQDPSAAAPLLTFSDDAYRSFAVVDLTAAYPGLSRVRRGIALIDGRDVLVQDELEGAGAADVAWQMLTRAAVAPNYGRTVLRQHGRALVLRVVEPVDAMVRASPALAPPPQAQQPDVTAIRVWPPRRAEQIRIVVWLSAGDRPTPPVVPLADWR